MDSREVRGRILEYLRSVGSASVYQIAKALGISYGAVQWHLYVLERDGVVLVVSLGKRRVAMLRDSLEAYLYGLNMTGFFKELWQFLRSRGVEGSTPLMEVVRMLDETYGEVASSLLAIARNLYYVKKG